MALNGSEDTSRRFVIVTGSSAGGIDPLCVFVESIQPGLEAPIVIAQHLPPQHESHLIEILAKRSRLPVLAISDRTPLHDGNVYVAGPGLDVEIIDDQAEAVAVVRAGPKPSIDRLFSSAANSHGDRVIAIIFSGLGQDGLAGAHEIKAVGGTVVVQEPSSAQYASMPLAIPPTITDIIARPEMMGVLVAGIIRGAAPPDDAHEQEALQTLLSTVRERTGFDFSQYKTPTIMRRLSRLMVAHGAASISDYARSLQDQPEGYARLASAFLIKVTEFFRDAELFDELRQIILPQLVDQARATTGELRIWSAGTSTGEEAYSLAILCAELLRERDDPITVRIFATDIDETAITFARRGVYFEEALRFLPKPWVGRYFVRHGESYEVSKRIRSMTVFGQHDLGRRPPFPRVDLVLCRNVLIYFTRELQTRALQLFTFSIRDGGILVLGKSESVGALADFFAPVSPARKIFRRQGIRIPVPLSHNRDGVVRPVTEPSFVRPARPSEQPSPSSRDARPNGHDTFGTFLAVSPLGVVVVDRRYDILAINSAARLLFEIHGVGVGDDLIHLAGAIDAGALREAVDAAFRGEELPAREFPGTDGSGEVSRYLHVICVPDRDAGPLRSTSVAVFVHDITEVVRARSALAAAAGRQDQQLRELDLRVTDLVRRQKALLQANDELTTANIELRSMNEQLLISVEEAASSNEEIETLNEEMQATNEELETLNEELQATVEELNATNDEFRVRSEGLERMALARSLEMSAIERQRDLLRRVCESDGPFAIVEGDQVVVSSEVGAALLAGRRAGHATTGERIANDGTAYTVRVEPFDDAGVLKVLRFQADG